MALFLPVLFYASAMQAVFLFNAASLKRVPGQLDEESAGLLAGVPGMLALVGMVYDANEVMWPRGVGTRTQTYRRVRWIRRWRPYENARGIIPDDAVAVRRAIGVRPYYLPDVKVIDWYGLTDATVARNPVLKPNSERRMAHDRRPPPGYLAERDVNFRVLPAAASGEQALRRAPYAVQFGADLWMPFYAPDLEWVKARFETFSYDDGADARFEKVLSRALHLISARFDVWLDGRRLLYVRDRCEFVEPFFLHAVPADPDDLPDERKKHGYDNLDFRAVGKRYLGATRQCVLTHELPNYAMAAIRTGQSATHANGQFELLWRGEYRLSADDRATGLQGER